MVKDHRHVKPVRAALVRSAAFEFAAIDRPAEQAAARSADDRADRPIASAVQFAAKQRPGSGTDDQAGRAIVAAAVIPSVISAPDAIAARQTAWFIITAGMVIKAAILGAFAMRGSPWRRVGPGSSRWHGNGGQNDGSEKLFHGDSLLRAGNISARHNAP